MMRGQLPALSPLAPMGLVRATMRAASSPERSRADLRSHLTRRFGAARALLTGSGTQALQVALEVASSLRSGGTDTVALPAYSCYDLITAATGSGSRVSFYDVDPRTLSPDMDSLRQALRGGASAVVVANLFGYPVDWDAVRAEATAAGAVLVEDAAQGLGSSWKGRGWGTFGDLTVLSFGRGKGWTGGAGGALLARPSAAAALEERVSPRGLPASSVASGLRAGAVSLAQLTLGRPAFYGLVASLPGTGLGETHLEDPSDPVDIPAFSAAAVLEHAEMSEGAVEIRRSWAAAWRAVAEAGPMSACVPLEEGESGFLRFGATCPSGALCQSLASALRAHGVMRSYPKPLPALEASAGLAAGPVDVPPGAAQLAERLLTFPTHPLVSGRDVENVTRRTRSFSGVDDTH